MKDDSLIIEEQEAEIVRTVYEKFVNTNMGYTGIAKYLNLQGIKRRRARKPILKNSARISSRYFWTIPFIAVRLLTEEERGKK